MKSLIPESKIKELLPQKYPFTMVSHLMEFKETSIITGLSIRENNIFIEDGRFNESGMIENIAQSIALHISYGYFNQNKKAPVGYIGAIKNVKVFGFSELNDMIITEVDIISEFMGVTLVEAKIICGDKLLMTAQMKTFLSNDPPLS